MEAECHLLFVPVRETRSGTLALCTARLPSGQRVGLAFTSKALLLSVEGPAQHWIRLDEQAVHDPLAPLGVDHIRVDPSLANQSAGTAVETDHLGRCSVRKSQCRRGRGGQLRRTPYDCAVRHPTNSGT